ncbi:hypothetical protein NEIRO03_0173 [Nematocida sp. AWRm78]|nr:hypothetical protein NEIRO02_0172 [Nematocida sp. AWRm79]KAI5182509.1 hypothetical protein NEIRO03_0173 [Nematocida sp. AWRm78]
MVLHQDKSLDKIKGDIKYKIEETMCLVLVIQGVIFDIEDILEEIHVLEDKISFFFFLIRNQFINIRFEGPRADGRQAPRSLPTSLSRSSCP